MHSLNNEERSIKFRFRHSTKTTHKSSLYISKLLVSWKKKAGTSTLKRPNNYMQSVILNWILIREETQNKTRSIDGTFGANEIWALSQI